MVFVSEKIDPQSVLLTWLSVSSSGSRVRESDLGLMVWGSRIWEIRIMEYGDLGCSIPGVPSPDGDCATIERHGPKTGDYSDYGVLRFRAPV